MSSAGGRRLLGGRAGSSLTQAAAAWRGRGRTSCAAPSATASAVAEAESCDELHRRLAGPTSWSSGDSVWFSASRDSAGAGDARGQEAAAAALAGGFAVVKRSEDPRADFRRSMEEMVVGRGIYDADGLERLLRCFLALNDRRHRRDIMAAFGDVWEAVFSNQRRSLTPTAAPLPPPLRLRRYELQGCSHVSSLDNALSVFDKML